MPEAERLERVLTAESLAAVDAMGPMELVVGVHVSGQARYVGQVLDAVRAGLAKHFSGVRTALLVADAGSQDGTRDATSAWMEAAAPDPPVQCLEYAGPRHRGRAIFAILAVARHLGVRAVGLLDTALTGLRPEWIRELLHPVLDAGVDYVSPAYTLAAWEGTLTTNLLAPVTRALYGKRIRQLVGGCAGLSGGLVDRLLGSDAWRSEWMAHGVEVWLPTEALAGGVAVAEAHLGRKELDPGVQPDVATTLVRTVGPLFALMEIHREAWLDVRGSQPVPGVGDPGAPAAEAEGREPGVERMVRAFKLGLKDLLPVWEQIMPETTLGQLYPLGLLAPDEFRFPPPAWARVVSDFAVAHHERRLPREHLLRALTPLYLGRVAAFVLEARPGPPARIPEILENIGRAFEAEKPRLAARWR